MNKEKLQEILEKHRLWLEDDEEGERADFQGALIDFSCWPQWCGSLDVKVDARIARQLAYHLCRLDCDDDDEEYLKVRDAIKDFANKFHRVEECGRIELKAENKPEVKDYWQGLLSEGEEYDV